MRNPGFFVEYATWPGLFWFDHVSWIDFFSGVKENYQDPIQAFFGVRS